MRTGRSARFPNPLPLRGEGKDGCKREVAATDPEPMIFQDAHEVHASALQKLAEGDVRDAAEKAWRATKRATDALILARTGEEPPATAMTSEGLPGLARGSADFEALVGRCFTRISYLRGTCFHNGMCGPGAERRIRETADYIRDAENLAYG